MRRTTIADIWPACYTSTDLTLKDQAKLRAVFLAAVLAVSPLTPVSAKLPELTLPKVGTNLWAVKSPFSLKGAILSHFA
jgi:hypothetical protein